MSTGRVLWIIWCLAWAGFWFFAGFATLGVAWIAMLASVVAIWLPVGVERPAVELPPERQELERPRPGGYQ